MVFWKSVVRTEIFSAIRAFETIDIAYFSFAKRAISVRIDDMF
jgi:hypothetical protein